MSFFSKLFGKKAEAGKSTAPAEKPQPTAKAAAAAQKPNQAVNAAAAEAASAQKPKQSGDAAALALQMMTASKKSLNQLAAEKDARPAVTEAELMQYFAEYFAPNKDFYSVPGSEKFKAYFGAVNAARDEMLKNPDLFKLATKWDISKLKEMIENPKPAITNMLICGLIFRIGDYGVLRASLLCVDFCAKIPNCIALYLLLTSQKLPKDKRRLIIDAGDNADKTAFKAAMESLKVLDPSWSFMIV